MTDATVSPSGAVFERARLERATGIDREIRWGFGAVGLFLGGFLLWSVAVPIAGAVVAPGTVVTDGHTRVVQHEKGGVLERLVVREGDRVKKGDLLLVLKRAEDEAERDLDALKAATLTFREKRLAAEAVNAEELRTEDLTVSLPPGLLSDSTVAEIRADQLDEFRSRRDQIAKQTDVLLAQRRALKDQQIGLEGEITSGEKQLTSLIKEIGLRQGILDQGFGRATVLRELERSRAGLEGSLGKARATLAATQHQLTEIDEKIRAIRTEFQTQVAADLSKTRAEKAQAERALAALLQAVDRVEIRAPADGVVNKLGVNTIGSAAQPFSPLVELVTSDEELLTEAAVTPHDIDNVKLGQKARIVFTAFDRRLVDPFDGEVVFVGADARVEKDGKTPFYTVRVKVAPAIDRDVPRIVPGMPSEVHLVTRERTFLGYVAEPFLDSFRRAFRH